MPDTQGGWQAEPSTNRLGIGCCGAVKQGAYGLLLGTRTKHPGMGESNKWQIVGHTNPLHPARDWAPRIREAIDLSLRNSDQWALGGFGRFVPPWPIGTFLVKRTTISDGTVQSE